ncbi:UNVERIFIED_CONTAM: hypothetical protein K2H54_001530 [Gekko kuhli]
MVCFHPEGDHALMSPQHFPRTLERRPWLSLSKNAGLAGFGPQQCLTPNRSACRLHLLRKGLAPEARWAQLGMYNSTGSLTHKGTETHCLDNSGCPSSGRVTAPCTPLRSRPLLCSPGSRAPLVAQVPGGHSSVVTFRFIEKASVKTLDGLPVAESRREGGLSRSLELGEALAGGSSKQGSCCPTAPKQHRVATSPEPAAREGSPWACSRESSAHAQRIAKAKWEFFYGSLDPPWAEVALVHPCCSEATGASTRDGAFSVMALKFCS